MKFIVVLLVVLLEYSVHTEKLKRFAWYPRYFQWVHEKLADFGAWGRLLCCIVLPALIVVLLKGVVYRVFHLLTDLLVGVAILMYCLGPENIFSLLRQLLQEAQQHPFCPNLLKKLAKVDLPQDLPSLDKRLAEVLLSRLNHALFAPVFWFSLLGVGGAVFYRTVYLFAQCLEEFEWDLQLGAWIKPWLALLEWVPAQGKIV
jgi:AmpE protein